MEGDSGQPEVRDLPFPDLARLQPLTVEQLIVALLATAPRRSLAQVKRSLMRFAPPSHWEGALHSLSNAGLIATEGRGWRLADGGRNDPLAAAVLAARADWPRTRATILPMVALGLPLSPDAVRRFSRGDNLRAATLAVLYDLPLSLPTVRLTHTRACLLARSLAAHYDGLRLPPINGTERLDAFSTAILHRMAGTERQSVSQTITVLTSRALGTRDLSLDGLRHALVTAAVARSETSPPVASRGARPTDVAEIGEFARRVQALADAVATPPFEDRLAISAAYELYGRHHTDAGTIASFKQRLAAAHRERWLSLRRLDYVDAITADLRQRSELIIDGRHFHFVARVS